MRSCRSQLAVHLTLDKMRLLIIRHADPEYVTDSLTAAGKKEAEALAARFSTGLEGRITHIYTSPKGRARATASYTEAALGKTAAVEEWTRELSYWPRLPGTERPGEGGLAMWDLSADAVRANPDLGHASQWSLVTDIEAARPHFEQLQIDSDAFLARHGYVRDGYRYRIVKPNRDIVAVFCHGGFGLTWLAHLLNIPLSVAWTSFYLAPSSVTTILFDERSADFASPRAIGISDTGHLYSNKLQLSVSKYERPNVYGNWKRPSGIKANFW